MKSPSSATILSKLYQKEISVLLRFLLGETVTCDPADQPMQPATLHQIAESCDRLRQAETVELKART